MLTGSISCFLKANNSFGYYFSISYATYHVIHYAPATSPFGSLKNRPSSFLPRGSNTQTHCLTLLLPLFFWLPFSCLLDISLNTNPSDRSSFFYLKLIPNLSSLPLFSILTSWLLPYWICSDLKCLFVHLLVFGLFLPLECKLCEAEFHPAYHFSSRTQHSALYIVITKICLSTK